MLIISKRNFFFFGLSISLLKVIVRSLFKRSVGEGSGAATDAKLTGQEDFSVFRACLFLAEQFNLDNTYLFY